MRPIEKARDIWAPTDNTCMTQYETAFGDLLSVTYEDNGKWNILYKKDERNILVSEKELLDRHNKEHWEMKRIWWFSFIRGRRFLSLEKPKDI